MKTWTLAVAFVALALLACSSVTPARAGNAGVLEPIPEPAYQVSFGYAGKAQYGHLDDSAQFEWDADWAFAYFSNVLNADADLGLLFRSTVFTASAGLELPDQLVAIAVDAGLTWQFIGGSLLEARIKPGFYSDFEDLGGAFAMPVSLVGMKSFNDELTGAVGIEYRSGFERQVFPVLGVRWEPLDTFLVKLMVPESEVTLYLDRSWAVHARVSWDSTTYSLREKGAFDREEMTVEEFRWAAGTTYRLSDEMSLVTEIGQVFDREIQFAREAPGGRGGTLDVEDAVLLRVAIVGPF